MFEEEDLNDIEFLLSKQVDYCDTMIRNIPKNCSAKNMQENKDRYVELLEKVREM